MAGPPRVLIVLASCLLLTLAGCSSNDPTPEPNMVVDLLQQDWQHTPGVTAGGGHGLQVDGHRTEHCGAGRRGRAAEPAA